MASNVFGIPITDATLRSMPQWTITTKDKAQVALNMRNAEQKYDHARQYVESLKYQWGIGVSTLCLVYNATGDTLTFVTSHDYYGQLATRDPYPTIANGQWAGFLHGKTKRSLAGSAAAIVYRGKKEPGVECDWMLAWSNPFDRMRYSNKVYTEIREARHYDNKNEEFWNIISEKVQQSGLKSVDEWNGCLSNVSTGDDSSPIVEAILRLKNDA